MPDFLQTRHYHQNVVRNQSKVINRLQFLDE